MYGFRGSLRQKIIVWSFVPTAIILVAVGLVSLYAYQQVTEDLVIERDRELTRLSASVLATELTTYADPRSGGLATFDGILVFSANGSILAAEPPEYEKWQPAWFQEVVLDPALSSAEPIFSDVVVDNLKGEKIFVAVMPLTGEAGQVGGGIAGFFRLGSTSDSVLHRSVERLRRTECKAIYLVDSQGQVLYHSDPRLIGDDFSPQPVVQRVLQGETNAFRTVDFEGEEIVASFAPVPATAWGLITEESWAALTAASTRYERYLIFLLALGVAVPTLIVTVGVKRITQPIYRLIHAARQIAGGDFGQRIAARTGDELEELAAQFNTMASRLQASYANLEQKVADRTRELATLNTIAAEVSQSLDLGEILNNALDEVLDVMAMDRGQAYCLDGESKVLILMAHRGISEELVSRSARVPLRESIIGQAAREGQLHVRQVVDLAEGTPKTWLAQEGIQLVVCAPLIAKGKTVGVLLLGTDRPRTVTPEEISLLTAIGHQIGVAVENAQLYEQAQQLAVMKERGRLARDLHDSVMQSLYGATLYAEAAARQLDSGDRQMVVGHLREIRGTTQEALREMRLLIFELRPPLLKQEGLVAALQARLEAVEARVGLETQFQAETNGRLPRQVEEGLYRIAQEALNNTLKHAQARSVVVRLDRTDGHVSLEITDDGCGFDLSSAQEGGGFGLCGMEERATRLGGKLRVSSEPGAGTKIRVEVCR